MSEINVNEKFIIDDVEGTIKWLENRSGVSGFTIDDIINFIKTQQNTIFYLDDKMTIKNENEKGIKYVWLDTGLQETDGNALFISLYASYDVFIGHYVGIYKFLSRNISEWNRQNQKIIWENVGRFKIKYEKRIEKREIKHITDRYKKQENTLNEIAEKSEENEITEKLKNVGYKTSDNTCNEETTNAIIETNNYMESSTKTIITDDIYNQLMINNWKSIDGLDRYIKVIGYRLKQLIAKNKEEYYVLNNLKSAIVNTGLLNQFGMDILVHYRLNVTYGIYEAYQLIESKNDMLSNNFTKEQILKEIKPISFFNDDDQMFSASIEEFDINYRNLFHIIEERKERFPDNIQHLSVNAIASRINKALEIGLKMQQRDKNYAKPIYSTKVGAISWMLPLHINKDLSEEPELVMVIRKAIDFYEVKTVLPYDDEMKDKMTALSLYNGMW